MLSWRDSTAVPGQEHVGRLSDSTVGEHAMVDNAVTVEQLQAELRRVQELYVAEVTFLRQREAGLIDEVEQRDRALAEAVEQQTATADILRIIASSPTDAQPVLNAITQSAMRLSES